MSKQQTGSPARPTLSAKVRDALLEHILNGAFKPGERLVEMRLAEAMGTSQGPVREALRELEVLGIVESSRNRGTRISAPSARELAEIYDVRAELEGYAASLSAASFSSLDVLQECIAEMVRCADRGDVKGFAEANANFHRTIVAACGNQTLLDIWTRLDVKSRTAVNIVRTARDLRAVARSHQAIVRALASGSPSRARSEVRKHILSFKPAVATADISPSSPRAADPKS